MDNGFNASGTSMTSRTETVANYHSNTAFGVAFVTNCESGKTYKINCVNSNPYNPLAMFYKADGTFISYSLLNMGETSFTVPNDAEYTLIMAHSYNADGTFTLTEFKEV